MIGNDIRRFITIHANEASFDSKINYHNQRINYRNYWSHDNVVLVWLSRNHYITITWLEGLSEIVNFFSIALP